MLSLQVSLLVAVVYLCGPSASVAEDSLLLSNVQRAVDLTTHLPKFTTSFSLENTGSRLVFVLDGIAWNILLTSPMARWVWHLFFVVHFIRIFLSLYFRRLKRLIRPKFCIFVRVSCWARVGRQAHIYYRDCKKWRDKQRISQSIFHYIILF